MTFKEPTNAEMRERHDKDENTHTDFVPDVGTAHTHRGILLDRLEATCIWKKQALGIWDKYDSWSTSCGEDYAIVDEWDETPTKYCCNCGCKTEVNGARQ